LSTFLWRRRNTGCYALAFHFQALVWADDPVLQGRIGAILILATACCHANSGEDPAAAEAARLQALIRDYYAMEAQSARTRAGHRPELTPAELAQKTYDPNKILLNGVEGSLVLAEFDHRINDPALPESRRETAEVCSLRTRVSGKLVASDQRSFRPVGKYQYLMREHLRPGEIKVKISGYSWVINIPEGTPDEDYLITLYKPSGEKPLLHAFPVAEFLAVSDTPLPDWLPDSLELSSPG